LFTFVGASHGHLCDSTTFLFISTVAKRLSGKSVPEMTFLCRVKHSLIQSMTRGGGAGDALAYRDMDVDKNGAGGVR